MSLPAGTRLGPYEIVSPLGAGGMGEVYRARDTRLDRTVAVKVLPQHLADTPEARERFDREARAVSSLNHPHICVLHDVGHQGSTDYLVMEYLEGETLGKRIERGPLPAAELLRIAVEVANALEKAHRQGILHRDLKPGNIMLTKAGAKLMDFGLAKATPAAVDLSSSPTVSQPAPADPRREPLTARGTIVGTFQYMAPEQIEGKETDARSDIFSFGAVLYEMATGKKAFEGRSQASLIAAILEREPPPISTLQPMSPPALDRVVKTCLEKDPDERFQTAHDLKLQLQWIGEGGSQAGVPAPVAAHRKARERVAWVAAAVFLILAGVAAAAYWQLARQPERAEISVWRTGFYNMIFLGVIGVFFLIYATPVVRLFTQDPEVVPLAASCLRILSYGNIGYAYGMVMLQAFNGAGDTVTPTVVNFFGFWLLEIPLAYFLALRVGWQAKGAYVSIVVAECAIALAGVLLFRRGKWKVQRI